MSNTDKQWTDPEDYEFVNETPDAILIHPGIDDDGMEIWLPRSQIDYTDNKDGTVSVSMPEW